MCKYFKAIKKLELISELKYNWDLHGAKPISKDLIAIMKNLIYELKYQPEIFPTAYGSIQFEYENKNKDYLEFELIDKETIKIFKMDSEGNEEYNSCKPNADNINAMLDKFY